MLSDPAVQPTVTESLARALTQRGSSSLPSLPAPPHLPSVPTLAPKRSVRETQGCCLMPSLSPFRGFRDLLPYIRLQCNYDFFSKNSYLFIWLHRVLAAARGI